MAAAHRQRVTQKLFDAQEPPILLLQFMLFDQNKKISVICSGVYTHKCTFFQYQ